jgi:hypothetical protein
MTRDHQHNPDPNTDATRILAEATIRVDCLPAEAEAAWVAWSAGIQKVDESTMTMLRAAFEAGFDVGQTDR